ncbi:MAG: hypothetical protein QE271_04650 [Bacteriovoracaceae bacterium]|nr:hypothetical protein [Bacteriovoracaceae bacterium]
MDGIDVRRPEWNQPLFNAYRSTASCSTWYLVPTIVFDDVSLLGSVEAHAYQFANFPPATGNVGKVVFTNSIEIQASPPTITPSEEAELKQKIAAYITNLSPEEREKKTFDGCPNGLSADRVILNMISVRNLRSEPTFKNAGTRTQYDKPLLPIRPEPGSSGQDEFQSAWGASLITLDFDGSNPIWNDFAKNIIVDRESQNYSSGYRIVGKTGMEIDSKDLVSEASISATGTSSAEYQSMLEKINCTVTKNEGGRSGGILGSTNILGTAAKAYAFGPLGGGIGAFSGTLASVFGKGTSTSTTCNYDLRTILKSGQYGMKVSVHFSANVKPKMANKYIIRLIDGERVSIPMDQYIEDTLWKMWLEMHFVASVSNIVNQQFDLKLQPLTGTSVVTFEGELHITNMAVENMEIKMPIMISNKMIESMGKVNQNHDWLLCAQRYYKHQILIFSRPSDEAVGFVPVADECLQ